jgi:hypothetical protein
MARYIALLLGVDKFDNPTVLSHEFTNMPADEAMKDSMVKKAANGGYSVEDYVKAFKPIVQSIKLS